MMQSKPRLRKRNRKTGSFSCPPKLQKCFLGLALLGLMYVIRMITMPVNIYTMDEPSSKTEIMYDGESGVGPEVDAHADADYADIDADGENGLGLEVDAHADADYADISANINNVDADVNLDTTNTGEKQMPPEIVKARRPIEVDRYIPLAVDEPKPLVTKQEESEEKMRLIEKREELEAKMRRGGFKPHDIGPKIITGGMRGPQPKRLIH
jgi:hypothetical protein